ncbi:MAG TPA: RDD family protein [Natronosporangium sp.]
MSLAPGWYKDPVDPTIQRWWDGEGWVGDPVPADQTPPDGPPPPSRVRIPQVPAIPGLPGAADAPPPPPPSGPVPPHSPTPPRPGSEVPPGWPVGRPPHPPSRLGRQLPPRPHGHALATIGARAVARLIDIGIVALLNLLVNGWFVVQYWQETEQFRKAVQAGEDLSDLPPLGDQAGGLLLTILVLAVALWFAYEVPAVANSGQTVGKRLLRIKVVRLEQAGPVGFGRSFRRWNAMGLPSLLWCCCGVGFIMQASDFLFGLFDRPLQQTLHDKSAHTVVISLEDQPTSGLAPDQPTAESTQAQAASPQDQPSQPERKEAPDDQPADQA